MTHLWRAVLSFMLRCAVLCAGVQLLRALASFPGCSGSSSWLLQAQAATSSSSSSRDPLQGVLWALYPASCHTIAAEI